MNPDGAPLAAGATAGTSPELDVELPTFPDANAGAMPVHPVAIGSADETATPSIGSLAALHGVEMKVTAVLGRARLPVATLLDLEPGAIVELDRVAGMPVDILVNGTAIAQGEVVVIDNEYGVRITDIVGAVEGS
jgi:flagellar motor switch protein FliN/FliY